MSWQRWGDREGDPPPGAAVAGCGAALAFALAVDAGLLWLIWLAVSR